MIVVNASEWFAVRREPRPIERIHASPDTTLILVDGSSYIVVESLDEIID